MHACNHRIETEIQKEQILSNLRYDSIKVEGSKNHYRGHEKGNRLEETLLQKQSIRNGIITFSPYSDKSSLLKRI